ncbi:MAG: hypothetical protein COX56_03290 [Zetaproteobacteria bacterium CG23_combo_of_CG06-09_8_20_14_all_59_86]|nr:MAG: hypothetical protein COX56_03290 [Zetaproteobacteria bacterium CG23_combo_of_CG06-09_8_20_14_all_59_86]
MNRLRRLRLGKKSTYNTVQFSGTGSDEDLQDKPNETERNIKLWKPDPESQRHDAVEQRQRIADTRLDKVFEAIGAREINPNQGIVFDAQVLCCCMKVYDKQCCSQAGWEVAKR